MTRIFLIVTGVLAALWFAGLFFFISAIPHKQSVITNAGHDGIVVLTGGAERLAAGIDLLSQERGRRLLVSGVHEDTTRDDLEEILDDPGTYFECCVDLDRNALTTRGNAQETALWVRANGYRSLIVVTAHYHMPRSLLEFHRAMPDVRLTAYPVFPDGLEVSRWWSEPRMGRLVLGEYMKFLASLVHLSV